MKIKRETLIIYFLTNNFLIMNKKLISALFVGALLLGSTSALTSCKDYDDDINSLQSQIDKAALQSSVDALKTDLASATATASAAKTTAESALAKAQAANDAVATKAAQADLTAAVARITALETAMKDVQAFEAQLKAASDSAIADMTTKFNALKMMKIISITFLAKFGSLLILKFLSLCGCNSAAFHICRTCHVVILAALAIRRTLQ